MIKKIISCGDIHIPSLRGIPELEETLSKFCDDCQAIVDKAEAIEKEFTAKVLKQISE